MSELLVRFHDDAIHCETETDCFVYPVMNRDWTASSNSVSFGHDAELAFLMINAMMAMGENPIDSLYFEKIRYVVDFTFTHDGYRSDGALYYTGIYNNGNVSITDYQLQWWPQAEGLTSVCLMRMLIPEERFALGLRFERDRWKREDRFAMTMDDQAYRPFRPSSLHRFKPSPSVLRPLTSDLPPGRSPLWAAGRPLVSRSVLLG